MPQTRRKFFERYPVILLALVPLGACSLPPVPTHLASMGPAPQRTVRAADENGAAAPRRSVRAADEGGTSIVPKTSPAVDRKTPLREASLAPTIPIPVRTEIFKRDSFYTVKQPITKLVSFSSAPFPYDGADPTTETQFLNVNEGGRRGHRTPRGRVYWKDETYSDNRVLLHIPKGFEINRPAVAVLYFHGHRANLEHDVRDRQLIPEQISASKINAVLIAPQFAVNASDSSAGHFWEPGACGKFYQEAAKQLAALYGEPESEQIFAKMPIVVVAYSGGFVPAASCLHRGGFKAEVRGVVLFDALYGETDKFANWIADNRSGFFLSAYTNYTKPMNVSLEHMLAERNISSLHALSRNPRRGDVMFVSADAEHESYLTQAWVENPLKDMLAKLPEYRR
jgi:hypothetical protein